MNRRESLEALGAFLIGPSFFRPFDPYFDDLGAFDKKKLDNQALQRPTNLLEMAKLRLKVYSDPPHELLFYRSALLGPKGELWEGPQILDCHVDPEKCTAFFQMQPIEIKETCTVAGIRLFHPQGEWRGDGLWNGGSQHCCPGDTLNANINLSLSMGL